PAERRASPPRGLGARARAAFRSLEPRASSANEDESAAEGGAGVPRRARFTAIAAAGGRACAGGERGLWCGTAAGLSRVPLPRGAGVRALLAEPGRPGSFLAATQGAVLRVDAGGGAPAVHVRLGGVRWLAASGARVFAA